MKMSQGKKFAFVFALLLMVPLFWNQSAAVASAATPALTESKVEIVGANESHQLEIKDKVTGSKYKWSSSNTKVAKVSSKGLVTTVSKGTANIQCKITYTSGKTKTLTCKVTVTILATDVSINNATEVNGAHILLLGQNYDFNCNIVPEDSSDAILWSYGDGGEADCIRIDDASAGTVTAMKVGKATLVATAVKPGSQADAEPSFINDVVIIEVVAPTATVISAEIIGSTELKVVFDSPIDASTVIGLNNKLLDSVGITMRKDIKGVLAEDPGALTASLSADLKALTITSANMLEGEYGVEFTSNIKTTGGLPIEQYYRRMSYVDNVPPRITNVELDDSGMISTIRFSEPIDFTNFKVPDATVLGTVAADEYTITVLENKLNYIISADYKSLTINLSGIVPMDYGKLFTITISGIKDMSGNIPASYTLTAILRTDNTVKAQARPLLVQRTSYNTLTATFDRALLNGGTAYINGGNMVLGIVDATDIKKVNYTITDSDALLTGNRVVTLSGWTSYNVNPSDTSALLGLSLTVNFDYERSNPVLFSYTFDAATSVLTLTYNKDVTIRMTTGMFSSTLATVTDDLISGTNITYTKMASTDKKVIKLLMGNMTLAGDYTFALEEGFVSDSYKTVSLSRTIMISNTDGNSLDLPRPYLIRQSTTNLSQIYVEFANKLDKVTAEMAANYSIPGVIIISAQLTNNTSENGATVILTVLDGSIDVSVERPITISGIRGYNGSYSEMLEYTTSVDLKDNKKPYYIDTPVFNKTTNSIQLSFNEQIQGTLYVRVTQTVAGSTSIEIPNTVTIAGNSAVINLHSTPANGTYLRIEILSNNITDLSGNVSTMQSQTGVVALY